MVHRVTTVLQIIDSAKSRHIFLAQSVRLINLLPRRQRTSLGRLEGVLEDSLTMKIKAPRSFELSVTI